MGWASSNRSTAARTASGSSGCSARRRRVSRHSASLALRALDGEEPRHEGRADDAARTTDQLDHVVRDVARHVAERAGVRVGEEHRRPRDLDRLPHRVLGHVRQVHEHPEAVQLANDLFAERREAAVRTLAGPRVGPRRVVVVREREVAGAEAREDPERAERGADRLASLDTDHRGHLAGRRDPLHVVGRAGELQPVGVRANEREQRVDLLERHRHRGMRVGEVRRDVHGPELPSHASPLQARKIRVQARDGPTDVGRLAFLSRLPQRPDEVVVPVDQRRGPEELDDPLSVLGSHRPDATQPPPPRPPPRRPAPPGPRRRPTR